MKKTAARGHTRKHTGTKKHQHHTAKHHPVHHHQGATAHGHHVHTVAKHPKHAKARGLALSGVAYCGPEALAASLRLQGLAIADDDLLRLHRLAGADDDTGAPPPVTLEAASEYGLAGVRLAAVAELPLDQSSLPSGQLARHRLEVDLREAGHSFGEGLIHGLILGVDLPGPHTVLATAQGWWSWGELWCPCEFPDAVIEAAWAVTWA